MKVVAVNGSPHKDGNTAKAIKTVFDALNKEGIETELIQLGGNLVRGCIDCGHCKNIKDKRCGIKDDMINDIIAKLDEADGIIIGSPVYFSNVTTEIKALIDRGGRIFRGNGYMLKNKPAAAVVAARRAGANVTYSAINYLFGINQMITVNSSYWNMTLSGAPDDYEKDQEAHGIFKTLGENMAWLIKKINS